MKTCNTFTFIVLFLLVVGCSSTKINILQEVLASDNPKIKNVMSKPDEFEIQIIYTQILRDTNNKVRFEDCTYKLNAKNYFYPASTVKFPIAILALEKLNTMDKTSRETLYTIEGQAGKLRFSEEITKVFAVSDNVASTNLLEFVGFDYVNEKMKSKGLSPFKLSHRLSSSNPANPKTKSVMLYKNDGNVLNLPSITNQPNIPLPLHHLKKGIGYIKNDTLVHAPFDFSKKNYFPLETLHNTMKRVVFPDAFKESERFNLAQKDMEFILFSMQNVPKNSGYNPAEYYDGYCKFLMFGDTKDNIPSNIKIYNKVGDAYGTMIDCAYIIDAENKIEFIVSATILVNKDKIFNDNIYEYETLGLPFLGELGRLLYAKNLKKSKLIRN